MKKKHILPIVGIIALMSIYIFYANKEKSKPRAECIIQPERTTINLFKGDKLYSSVGFGQDDVVYWRKGMSKPNKIIPTQSVKDYRSINPDQGYFTYHAPNHNFRFYELVSQECFNAIP